MNSPCSGESSHRPARLLPIIKRLNAEFNAIMSRSRGSEATRDRRRRSDAMDAGPVRRTDRKQRRNVEARRARCRHTRGINSAAIRAAVATSSRLLLAMFDDCNSKHLHGRRALPVGRGISRAGLSREADPHHQHDDRREDRRNLPRAWSARNSPTRGASRSSSIRAPARAGRSAPKWSRTRRPTATRYCSDPARRW